MADIQDPWLGGDDEVRQARDRAETYWMPPVLPAVQRSPRSRTPTVLGLVLTSIAVVFGLFMLLVAMLALGFSTDELATSWASTEPPFPQLQELPRRPISIVDGEVTYLLKVAVADTYEARGRGLLNASDLEDLDGMLYVWAEPTSTSFWPKDTMLPLDIAFFAKDRTWVDNYVMAPCVRDDCPFYRAAGEFMYAVEVPNPGFVGLTAAATLVLDP
jgi:uncharacterized membrane protein (UPF0127 family)